MTLPTTPESPAGAVPRRSGWDQLRREAFLARLELWLDEYPRARRRAVLAELRAAIDDDAAQRGMPTALRALGTPLSLAREYLATEPGNRPRPSLAAVVVGGLLALWLVATMVYAAGMSGALLDGGGGSATSSFLGVTVGVVSTPQELGVSFSYGSWVPLAVLVVVFVLVARPWRALARTPRADT